MFLTHSILTCDSVILPPFLDLLTDTDADRLPIVRQRRKNDDRFICHFSPQDQKYA